MAKKLNNGRGKAHGADKKNSDKSANKNNNNKIDNKADNKNNKDS